MKPAEKAAQTVGQRQKLHRHLSQGLRLSRNMQENTERPARFLHRSTFADSSLVSCTCHTDVGQDFQIMSSSKRKKMSSMAARGSHYKESVLIPKTKFHSLLSSTVNTRKRAATVEEGEGGEEVKKKINKEASWLHAELFFVLVSLGFPGHHMSMSKPCGFHVETMWCPCGNHVVSMWKLCSIHM